jgi:hypothetical protein
MLNPQALSYKLTIHVYRLTGKRLSAHLLRTLFVSHAITSGMDVNSVAYMMNDKPATVLEAYNELQAQQHQQVAQDFYRRALKPGNGQTLTPPVIPETPPTPRRPRVSEAQLDLL